MARSWDPSFTYSDRERWVCIYPVYLNSKRSVTEGRKIPKELSIENPSIDEIRDVCTHLKLNMGVEDKAHPREPDKFMYRGRVRVQLKNDNGIPVSEEFQNRRALFVKIAELIGKLKSRQGGAAGGAGADEGGQAQSGQSKKQKKKKR